MRRRISRCGPERLRSQWLILKPRQFWFLAAGTGGGGGDGGGIVGGPTDGPTDPTICLSRGRRSVVENVSHACFKVSEDLFALFSPSLQGFWTMKTLLTCLECS